MHTPPNGTADLRPGSTETPPDSDSSARRPDSNLSFDEGRPTHHRPHFAATTTPFIERAAIQGARELPRPTLFPYRTRRPEHPHPRADGRFLGHPSKRTARLAARAPPPGSAHQLQLSDPRISSLWSASSGHFVRVAGFSSRLLLRVVWCAAPAEPTWSSSSSDSAKKL